MMNKPIFKKALGMKRLLEQNILKFCPLGGFEEVGRNCIFFEYQDEIIVVDAGIQFPEEETPGIDFIIPNMTYLEPKKRNIKALILTHGHYDHIHALPYIIEKLGNPIIYAAPLTKALVEKRFDEFPNLPKLKFQIVKDGEKLRLSDYFEAEFFDIGHNIPDGLGFILDTPVGKMVHFGDFRVNRDIKGDPIDGETFRRLSDMGIHSVFLDSTNADIEGASKSEETVVKELEILFKKAEGRIIVTTFASLLDRLSTIIEISEKLGRKVAINGRSMKDNIQIMRNLGYLKVKKGQIVNVEELHGIKDDKIMILTTGGQGEPNAGLTKIANGEHRHLKFKPTDTVIFSSSVVPGNERSVQTLQDNIARQVSEVYNSKFLDIHASGHAPKDDLKLVIELMKPKFVIPANAYYFKRKACAKIAREAGIPAENAILIDNGQFAEISKTAFKVTEEKTATDYVMVDGLGVGDVQEVVLRDRRMLAQEGMVVVIATIERSTGRLLKNPDIISRGFIYLKENKELLDGIRIKLKHILGRLPRHQHPEPDYIKGLIRDQIGQLLYNKTKRRPMILPVLIEV
ncbi:MAG: ribonuclease J [Candidatus Pacebacteria bacterium]|nr:ribonuclease J [Candidatus Paceibacterota bacterium]